MTVVSMCFAVCIAHDENDESFGTPIEGYVPHNSRAGRLLIGLTTSSFQFLPEFAG